VTFCEAGDGKDLQNVGDTTHGHAISLPKRSICISIYWFVFCV